MIPEFLLESVSVVSVDSVYAAAEQIEIFLYTSNYLNDLDSTERKFYITLLQYPDKIACLDINMREDATCASVDAENMTHPIITHAQRFDISDADLQRYDNSYVKVLYERPYHQTISTDFHIKSTDKLYEFYMFKRISLMLEYEAYKNRYITIMKRLLGS